MDGTNTKVLSRWNGSSNNAQPAGWYLSSFDDSTWAVPTRFVVGNGAATALTNIVGQFGAATVSFGPNPLFGAERLWSGATPASATEAVLFRTTFTLPDLVPAHLEFLGWHAVESALSAGLLIYVNGTAASELIYGQVSSQLVPGQNLIAVSINDSGTAESWGSLMWLAWVLRFSSTDVWVWGNEPAAGQSGQGNRYGPESGTFGSGRASAIPRQAPIYGVSQIAPGMPAYSASDQALLPNQFPQGQGATLWLTEDGVVFSSGPNTAFQNANSGSSSTPNPTVIAQLLTVTIKQVAVNGSNGWALDTDGNLWTWGRGANGENLAAGVAINWSNAPFPAAYDPFITLSDVARIATLDTACVALGNDGLPRQGGYNSVTSFPTASYPSTTPPQWDTYGDFSDGLDVVDVATCGSGPLFVMQDGSARGGTSAGNAAAGTAMSLGGTDAGAATGFITEVGSGNLINQTPPPPPQVVYSTLGDIVRIMATGADAFYLDSAGNLWEYGGYDAGAPETQQMFVADACTAVDSWGLRQVTTMPGGVLIGDVGYVTGGRVGGNTAGVLSLETISPACSDTFAVASQVASSGDNVSIQVWPNDDDPIGDPHYVYLSSGAGPYKAQLLPSPPPTSMRVVLTTGYTNPALYPNEVVTFKLYLFDAAASQILESPNWSLHGTDYLAGTAQNHVIDSVSVPSNAVYALFLVASNGTSVNSPPGNVVPYQVHVSTYGSCSDNPNGIKLYTWGGSSAGLVGEYVHGDGTRSYHGTPTSTNEILNPIGFYHSNRLSFAISDRGLSSPNGLIVAPPGGVTAAVASSGWVAVIG